MAIITETQIKNQRRSTKTYMSLNESLRSFKSESSYLKTKIFLSHKHDEKEFLEGAISLLKTYGVEVYVDWLDEGMPKQTSGITAKRIKEKIKENQKFIFLATEGTISSKWCNWELGFGDAQKYINHIAILPVSNDYSSFSGAEYFQIYPYIKQSDYIHSDDCYVVYPDGTEKNLKTWLRT